ncbi:hypothetical protein CLOSTMETH_01178 [[Clostridium] methylpentosum DSM 5476]|uniref:Uncharacterized protein n=1 Tax=[Clostridium] methylpentosum DSM 5476 TaxID=537013 RepID=C0EBG0_9FIRM|nr:hypothetical protein CLOSTMETH_01178 [[Clostridium] methylpentosum DSM 5476]
MGPKRFEGRVESVPPVGRGLQNPPSATPALNISLFPPASDLNLSTADCGNSRRIPTYEETPSLREKALCQTYLICKKAKRNFH